MAAGTGPGAVVGLGVITAVAATAVATGQWALLGATAVTAVASGAGALDFYRGAGTPRRQAAAAPPAAPKMPDLDASPGGGDLIAIIGPEGTLQQISESGADCLAMSVGRVLGVDVMRLVHPEDRGHLVGMVIEAEQQGESDPFRVRLVRGDSTWATFDMWALALPLDPHSEDLAGGGAILIGRSVSERSAGSGPALRRPGSRRRQPVGAGAGR